MTDFQQNLVEGNYYFNYYYGICQYIGMRDLEVDSEIKKYYLFKFGKESLYVPIDQSMNLTDCDPEFAMIKGTPSLNHR